VVGVGGRVREGQAGDVAARVEQADGDLDDDLLSGGNVDFKLMAKYF